MSNRLRELRKERKFTLDELSARTGIKRGTLNNYELGKTEPKMKSWEILANTYGVTVSYVQGISDFRSGYPETPIEFGETTLETFKKRYATPINEGASDEEKKLIAEGADGYNDLLSLLTYAPTNSDEENKKKRELLEKFRTLPTAINVYLTKPSEIGDDSLYPIHDEKKLNITLNMLNDAMDHLAANLNAIGDTLYK